MSALAVSAAPLDATRTAVGTNGIELSVYVAGGGPTVVLCHGFPELAYSWRHQIAPLSEAGFRVVVPDMRGFGASSRPEDVGEYDIETLSRDMVGLLDDLEVEEATFVGHDWGAAVVWHLALAHPRRVRAVAGLSVPFARRAAAPPVSIFRRRLGEEFYMVWFQEPGIADAALARDVRRTLTARQVWTAEWAAELAEADSPPSWLTEEELQVYVRTFEQTGFSGGLNYYRNIDRNWELSESFAEATIDQPSMFLTGSRDAVRKFMPAGDLGRWLTDLRAEVVLDGAGHWIQQERPDAVNEALLSFLASVHG